MKTRLAIALMLALAACGRSGSETTAQGYIEGEYINVAPQVTARIVKVLPETGEWLHKGATVAELDPTDAEALRAQAAAQLAAAQASLTEAQANLRQSTAEFQRQSDLVARHDTPQSTLDVARQAYETAGARVTAAERGIDQARAQLADAQWQLSERTLHAPADGPVDEIFFRAGEVAVAGHPILSMLPPERRKVRFFVTEADLPRLKLGAQVLIRCDGCTEQIPAEITFISNQAEYTPPVIYSLETRAKLVFKIEARPTQAKTGLRVGLPVDVLLPDARPRSGP
jgi:HlyD family secretion protein